MLGHKSILCAILLLAAMLFAAVPAGAQINNGTPSIWNSNPLFAIALAALCTILLIIIGISIFIIKNQKQNKQDNKLQELLHAVNNAATVLLTADEEAFEGFLKNGIEHMAACIDIDRVYIWKNEMIDGRLYYVRQYEWVSSSNRNQEWLTVHPDMKYLYDDGVPGWEEAKFRNGECINSPVSSLSQNVQDMLGSYGIKSILVIPVNLHGYFWGLVSFDDCRNERIFTNDEVDILRSACLMMVSVINRKDMANKISATAAKLQAVVTNYTGVIWSVDKNNVITLFNGLYLKEIGVLPSFIEGKSLDIAMQKNRHSDIIENVQKTFFEGPQDWISEIDGKKFHARTVPIYNNKGSVTGVVGSIDDLTEIILLQEKLEVALKEAQEASLAKSNFLSNMSHEIRTPMNAIIGMTNIGKSATDMERMLYAFERIGNASNHLLGVINDILDISKIEAGKFELCYEEFNFEKMLQKTANIVNFRIEEKRQRFTVFIDKHIPRNLICDDQRLTQTITNLLSNAVKFTPEENSIRLDAHLEKEENGICTIKIAVTDTGIGISAEQQARLFSSFQQAESSTSRKFGGTGLGLAISKHIIELMGGNIWVESELGAGATFTFTIPVKRGSGQNKRNLLPGLANIRILIVDNDQESLDCFINIASQLGVTCDTAASSADALRNTNYNAPYDIYFVSWAILGMNGIELSRKITVNSTDKPVILMLTATEWNKLEQDAKAAGVTGFLSKPLFTSTIADCINKYLGTATDQATVTELDKTVCLQEYRLLLVEDIEINREIVLAMLESTRLAIDCAENGVEAVRMFSETPDRYDIIFMDIQMPEMDGYEATQKIRSHDTAKAKEIPIIAMTANVFREDIEKCLEAGMSDHIGKPLDTDDVLNIILRYLQP